MANLGLIKKRYREKYYPDYSWGDWEKFEDGETSESLEEGYNAYRDYTSRHRRGKAFQFWYHRAVYEQSKNFPNEDKIMDYLIKAANIYFEQIKDEWGRADRLRFMANLTYDEERLFNIILEDEHNFFENGRLREYTIKNDLKDLGYGGNSRRLFNRIKIKCRKAAYWHNNKLVFYPRQPREKTKRHCPGTDELLPIVTKLLKNRNVTTCTTNMRSNFV